MKDYYSQRAMEYEKIYHREDPVRQAEQKAIAETLQTVFKDKRVLEVACGTGYWTERLMLSADRVTGVDASAETLEIARSKGILGADFIVGDAYALNTVKGDFDGGLANFWLSHVPKSRLEEFISGLHKRLEPGAVVFMADNMFVEGVGGELIQRSGEEDTYKLRTLEDGSTYEILKNYYDDEALKRIFNPAAEELNIHMGECFWWLSYRVKADHHEK